MYLINPGRICKGSISY